MPRKVFDTYNKLPVAAKASVIYLVTNFIQRGVAFVLSPIFIRMMSAEEYGNMSVYYTDAQLVGTLAMFSLGAGCFDVGMQNYKNDRYRFLFSILILSNAITVITWAFFGGMFPLVGNYLKVTRPLVVCMFVEFLLQPAFMFWTRAERYVFKYRMPAFLTVIGAVLSSCASIVAICFFPNCKVEARVWAAVICMIPVYIFFWVYLGKKANFKIDFVYIKFAFLFNLPLIPHYLSCFVLNSSDRIMIANICGSEDAAYYSLAYNVAAIVSLIWTSINSAIVPYVFDKYEKKEYKTVSKNVLPVLSCFAVICLVIVLMAPEVIKLLGTDEYYQAVYVIPPVVGGMFFQALYFLFTNVLYYYKKPKIVMIASVSTAILNIWLNSIFIRKFGFVAAGYTTLVCFMIQALLDYFVARKVVGQDIYSKRYLLLLSLLVIIVSMVANVLYSFLVFRYFFVIVMCFVLFMMRSAFWRIIS